MEREEYSAEIPEYGQMCGERRMTIRGNNSLKRAEITNWWSSLYREWYLDSNVTDREEKVTN